MYKYGIIAAACLIFAGLASCSDANIQNVKLENSQDSLSYAIGVNIGESFKSQNITEVDAALMAVVIDAIIKDDTANLKMDATAAMTFIQSYMTKKQDAEDAAELEKGNKWLEENAKKSGVKTTASGLQYEILSSGSGASPVETDQVQVHYTGKFVDGEIFDSSIEGGQPVTFGLMQVIPGWTEGLKMMKEGDKWMLYIPSNLAWGENGFQGMIPPNAAVIFEVELLKVIKPGETE